MICDQEIAIRVFRTAHELAMHTVAIYSHEDRMSAHRQKVGITTLVLCCIGSNMYVQAMSRAAGVKNGNVVVVVGVAVVTQLFPKREVNSSHVPLVWPVTQGLIVFGTRSHPTHFVGINVQ